MSPEINGNPPSVTKRKKNRDKKQPTLNNLNVNDLNMSGCNYFPSTSHHYQNLSIPDISAYYSFVNYSNSSEPMSLPIYPMNYPNYPYMTSSPNFLGNVSTLKFNTLPNNSAHINGDNTEYLSLPVVNIDQNEEETSKRRYSDPGVPNESDSSVNSVDERIIQKLTQQVRNLKESNHKLSKEVMEMRIELNILKQQQQSTRHCEREYEPGMLADIIREVRDAARVREDALLAKVKHLIEEKQLNMNHLHLVAEKNRNNDRLTKLEEQLKNLNVNQSRHEESPSASNLMQDNNSSARQVLELEREALELRRELQDTRAKKEEADQKLQQLDKKLSNILRRNDICTSEISEDGKTTSIDSLSITSSVSQIPPRITLSGPVTDL